MEERKRRRTKGVAEEYYIYGIIQHLPGRHHNGVSFEHFKV